MFKPFSNENNGAVSVVRQKLTFLQDTVRGVASMASDLLHFDRTGSLAFGHDHKRTDSVGDVDFVTQLLDRHDSVESSQLPALFDKLVYSMRSLKHSDMINIYYDIKVSRTKKFFQDALPLLKTDAGVTLMKDILTSGELSSEITHLWFSSLAFYKNPSRGMLILLSSFINSNAPKSALLGISSLASTFCSNNPKCSEVAEFNEVLSKFEALLGSSCEANSLEEEEKIVLALKGIRNIGQNLQRKDILKKCYTTKSNSVLVRVSAIETIRKWKIACQLSDRELLDTLRDVQEDSEIRINAYLAVMTCPTESDIENIKSLLESEEVNQVGSFIWTHMGNLQETNSKIGGKNFLKRIIGSDYLQNRWSSDVRKFSRNFEVSHFSNDWRLGGTAESNLIFSEKSFIPRSLMMNLTLNLFGENVNVLEVGGRLEGYDNLLEEMFGPDGYFKDDTVHNFLKTMSQRHRRDTGETLQSQEQKPKGNLYMRSFGKDVKFSAFSGIPQSLTNLFRNPLSILGSTFGNTDVNFEKSSMFLDGSIIIPTVSGLPMNMTARGSSSVQMKSSTKLNLSEFPSKRKASIDAEISPSGEGGIKVGSLGAGSDDGYNS